MLRGRRIFIVILLLLNFEIWADRDIETETKEWTILIYMAADNDLTPYALWDIYEMERLIDKEANLGATTSKVNVIVELDTIRETGRRRIEVTQTNRPYDKGVDLSFFQSKSEDDIDSKVVEILDETEVTAAQQLRSFLEWGVKKYPAKNNMVVIWGHGEGYISQPLEGKIRSSVESVEVSRLRTYRPLKNVKAKDLVEKEVFGGVAFDYTQNTYLNIPDLAQILREINDLLLPRNHHLNILALDVCLLQSIEVAAELMNSVDFIVGSAQIQNYLGLPYKLILDKVNSKKSPVTPYELARSLPELSSRAFENYFQGEIDPEARNIFTFSTLATDVLNSVYVPQAIPRRVYSTIPPLLPAISFFTSTFIEYFKGLGPFEVIELVMDLERLPRFIGENRDLGTILGAVEKHLYNTGPKDGQKESKIRIRLRRSITEALRSLQYTMMKYAYGSEYNVNEHYLRGYFKALSVWFPTSKDLFEARRDQFTQSIYYKFNTHWHGLIELLFF